MNDVPARIRAHLRLDGTCWRWGGALNAKGYALISWQGRMRLGHRLLHELLVRPIPDGHDLDHVRKRGCRHRDCVNSAHLEPVTHRDNLLRGEGIVAVNARKVRCVAGHLLEGDNLYAYVDRKGGTHRYCKACRRARKAAA